MNTNKRRMIKINILSCCLKPTFSEFARDFKNHLTGFKKIFDSSEPHRENLPGDWAKKLDKFQKIIVLRCLRADKVLLS